MTDTKQVRDARSLTLVSALVNHGLVDATRESEAVDLVDRTLGGQQSPPSSMRQRFAELAGYVGGAFVVSAALIFFADRWDSLTAGQQVALLAGTAMALAASGVVLALVGGGFAALRVGKDPVRRRLAGVLFTGAASSAAVAVGLQLETPNSVGEDAGAILAASLMLIVVSALGYLLAPTVIGQLGVAVGALMAIPVGLDFASEGGGGEIAVGASTLVLGVLWLALAESGVWKEVASARVVGSAIALFGAQFAVLGSDHEWFGYLATALVAAAGFAAYVARTAWPYLAVGVIGVTLAVPEALLDWTDGTLGSAGVLLITGVTLLVSCLVGLRLRQEVTEEVTS